MILMQDSLLQTEKTLSLIELVKDGGMGSQLIIGLLFLLLIIVIYIYFERLFAIKSASKISPNFMEQIKTYVLNHKIDGAQAICLSENKPVARLVAKGLSRIGRPLDDISTTIENAGGNIDMQLLSSGLYTAMTTTVAGLIVGIVGYITYNHLVVKTNKVVYQMEATSLEFFDLLNEPA